MVPSITGGVPERRGGLKKQNNNDKQDYRVETAIDRAQLS